MKKIKLKGGLGNQMFQYAYGRNVMLIQDKETIFDISFFIGNKFDTDTNRYFSLKNFNIPSEIKFVSLSDNSYQRFIKKILRKLNFKSEEYFQSEKYFENIKDTIRKEFTLNKPLSPKATEWLEKINTSDVSISIHVRRGDYISNQKNIKIYKTCDQKYYESAIYFIKDKYPDRLIKFFIFSDDIEWVKNNLKIDNAFYVSSKELQDYEELILMSKCKNQITSNSTFAWWGAWLNPNNDKIIITPKQWFLDAKYKKNDIVPTEWIKL